MKFDPRKLAHYFNFDFDYSPDSTILISGIARSGTTWVAEVLNIGNTHRLIDEPFFPSLVSAAGDFHPNQLVVEGRANDQLLRTQQEEFSPVSSGARGAIGTISDCFQRAASSKMFG